MTTPSSPDPRSDATQPTPVYAAPLYAAPAEPAPASAAAPAPAPTATSTPAPAPARRSGGPWLNVLLVVALAIAVGGVAFAVGRSTAPAAAATTGNGFPNGGFVGAGNGPQGSFTPGGSFDPGPVRGGFLGGGSLTLTGTVTAVDADGVTIKLASGDEVTIATDGSTTYHTATAGSASDVTVGRERRRPRGRRRVRRPRDGERNNGNGNNGNGNNGNGNGNGNASRTFTAGDVTVRD